MQEVAASTTRLRHGALACLAAVALSALTAGCRKEGASTEAVVVTSLADLKGAGSLSVAEVRRAGVGTEVVLVVDNTGARPLRIARLDIVALDSKGFVKQPVASPPEITVPGKAKDRLVVAFDSAGDKLVKARIWGVDHDLPAATR